MRVLFIFILCAAVLILAVSARAESVPLVELVPSVLRAPPGAELELGVLVGSAEPINAFLVTLAYPAELFEFVRARTAHSVASVWEPGAPDARERGRVRIAGGMLKPFSGEDGELITLIFRAKQEGTAVFSARVAEFYLADGKGTKRVSASQAASVRVDASLPSPHALLDEGALPRISDVTITQDPLTKTTLVFARIADVGAVREMQVRSRAWLKWGEWQIAALPAVIPAGAWAVELKAISYEGQESVATIYRFGAAAAKALLLFSIGAVLAFASRALLKRRLLGVVTLLLLLFAAPDGSHAATQAATFLSPAGGTFLVGSTFDVSIILDTKGVAANTIEVELNFPADKIQVANPSIGRSIIQLWPAPPIFSNREGKIYFVGGIPSPGVVTSQGVVLTTTFRVISPGDGEIRFGKRSSVLANDGLGTNILGQKPSAFYKFVVPPPLGPAISSPTHPDQERWYRDTNPVFVWPKSQFTTGYSWSIDRDPSGFPDAASEGAVSTVSYQNLENGIWYFHLRERSDAVWGGVSHYIVKIDNQPPAAFRVLASPSARTTERNPVFRFFTTDALSGLDHFEMKIVPLSAELAGEAFFFEVASPYQAVNMAPGRYQAVVRALDTAGNSRDEAVAMRIVGAVSQFISPEGIDFIIFFMPWSFLLLVASGFLLIVLIIFIALWRRHKHHLKHAFSEDIKALLHLAKKIGGGAGPAAALMLAASGFALSAHLALAQQPAPPAPIVSVAPTSYYPLDESLYIEGRAEPKSKVELFFEKPGLQPVRLLVDANSNGEWFFAGRLELTSGEWMLRARVARDPPSDWSNPRLIQSRVTGFIFGSLKLRYLPVVVTIMVLTLGAAALLGYSFLRLKRVKRLEAERETREKTGALEKALRDKEKEVALSAVGQSFHELRGSIREELDHFEERAKEGGLSKEEAEHRQELLRRLEQLEESIGKKVKEIL